MRGRNNSALLKGLTGSKFFYGVRNPAVKISTIGMTGPQKLAHSGCE
jgi:hypothetical protein